MSGKNYDIKYILQQKIWQYSVGITLHSPLTTNTNVIPSVLRCRGRMLVGLRMPGLLVPRETKGLKGASTQINQLKAREHPWSQTGNLASVRILESLGIWASVINHPCYGIFFHVIIMSCEVFPLATPTQHCSLSYSCDNLVGIKVRLS